MASDYALLFSPARVPRGEAWLVLLRELRAVGAIFTGKLTRMSFDKHVGHWRLTTETHLASTTSEVSAVLNRWDGAAVELESKLGPIKLLTWTLPSNAGSAVGLFESSSVFMAQASDEDFLSIMNSVAIKTSESLGTDCFWLVGDPGIVECDLGTLKAALQQLPSARMDPLVFIATLRDPGENLKGWAPDRGWLVRPIGSSVQYINPAFHEFERGD